MTVFAPTAKILADSIAPNDHRLTTMEVTGHRFILAELNTHRVFSRNSASSRAIPYAKMRAKVLDLPAYPVEWRAEQKGMQGGDLLPWADTCEAIDEWNAAAESAVKHADALVALGLHKSIVNRLLEPFIPHTAIISATDWDGFWAQRCHPDAQPEIRVLAEEMRKAYDNSQPALVEEGQWHTPLVDEEDGSAISAIAVGPEDATEITKHISVARCARVSYLTHDGKRDIDKDLELYNRLRHHVPAHASPFEHVATPGSYGHIFGGAKVVYPTEGNFTGWMQLRHLEGLG